MPGNAAVLTASADSVSILRRCDSNVWCHYNLAQSCLYSIAFFGPAADKMAASLAGAGLAGPGKDAPRYGSWYRLVWDAERRRHCADDCTRRTRAQRRSVLWL